MVSLLNAERAVEYVSYPINTIQKIVLTVKDHSKNLAMNFAKHSVEKSDIFRR